ncbi:MAG TPA: tetratricopeptide repeat protein [Patescibacteria group bacterium]|nr:tetratricopeptide repeat protein [Patescibacteria group bacterium]
MRKPSWFQVSDGILVFLSFLLPLFFLPWTLDVLEEQKQTLLVVLVSFALFFKVGGLLVQKKISLRLEGLLFLPFFFLSSVFLSALFSQGRFLSWMGTSTQEYVSVISVFFFLLFFFLVSQSEEQKTANRMLGALGWSAFLAGGLGLCSLYEIFPLPFSFAHVQTFNTVGTVNTLVLFTGIVVLLLHGRYLTLLGEAKNPWKLRKDFFFLFAVSIVGLWLFALVDHGLLWAVWVVGFASLALFSLGCIRDLPSVSSRIIFPLFLFVLGVFLWIFPPIFRLSIPVEVGLSWRTGFSVAGQTLTSSVSTFLFGSGPGTFLSDFLRFRPVEINTTPFWDTRFDRAGSHALTQLATLGFVGFSAWMLLLAGWAIRSTLVIFQKKNGWEGTFVFFPAWIAMGLASFVYASNMSLQFLFFLLTGILALVWLRPARSFFLPTSPRKGLLFSFACVFGAFGLFLILFAVFQRSRAERAFAQAVRLEREGASWQDVTVKMDEAASLNRFYDVSYRNLASVLLFRVQEALKKMEGQDPTEEQRIFLQALSAASIDAASEAVRLEPSTSLNWMAQGVTYRSLFPLVENAGTFAIKAFEKTAELDPVNPVSWTELGKTFFAMAETARPLVLSEDARVRTESEKEVSVWLGKAEEAFRKALELKQDYAPAHYHLAILFEREGKVDDAIGKMESVLRYNPTDVGAAFQLGLLYVRRRGPEDLNRAKAAFEYTVRLAPSYSNARWFLAAVYEQQGDLEAATQQVEDVLRLNPGNALVKARLERLKAGQTVSSESLPPLLED